MKAPCFLKPVLCVSPVETISAPPTSLSFGHFQALPHLQALPHRCQLLAGGRPIELGAGAGVMSVALRLIPLKYQAVVGGGRRDHCLSGLRDDSEDSAAAARKLAALSPLPEGVGANLSGEMRN
jgi:hypothetical protein